MMYEFASTICTQAQLGYVEAGIILFGNNHGDISHINGNNIYFSRWRLNVKAFCLNLKVIFVPHNNNV